MKEMNKLKKIICFILMISMVYSLGMLTGCSSNEPKARETLENYLSFIKDENHTAAYQLISNFDKNTVTEEVFNEWRSSVEKIVKKKSFNIGIKFDRFQNYEYMGTRFKDVYGFDVKCEQEYLVEGAKTTDYDMDNFKIMVVEEDGSYKIALMIVDLKEKVDSYKKMVE
jgi:hypothetical protein